MKKNAKFFEIKTNKEFNDFAMKTFNFQYRSNWIYKKYCDLIGINLDRVNGIEDIPYLPIIFFKKNKIKSFKGKSKLYFTSSGTTSKNLSTHHLNKIENYKESFNRCFKSFYGPLSDLTILALLPSYLKQKNSSLIFMMNELINETKKKESGFYLYDYEKLSKTIDFLEKNKRTSILIGIVPSLFSFGKLFPKKLNHTIIMETGGLKSLAEELTRKEIHLKLKDFFGVNSIHSEYGMTELLSQGYSVKNGVFKNPPWMKMYTYELNNPFKRTTLGKVGRLNIIDLANQDSCSFISTDDIGRSFNDYSYEVLGRLNSSDIRGCNLLFSQ